MAVREVPEVARRPLNKPVPGETPLEKQLRLARNDVVNIWRWMDGWYARKFDDPHWASVWIHLQLEYHNIRLGRIERMLERQRERSVSR